MSSILVGIYKATLGLLVNKVRDKTAEKLKDSDVVDQTFRDLIVREIDDIKTKLDGLARKDLLASIEFFKTGIANLNQVFESSLTDRSCEETAAVAANSSQRQEPGFGVDVTDSSAQVASHVTKRIEDLRVTDLDTSASQSLADASKRFEAARLEATRAFSNALKTSDRILALKIQLMATILERLDRPSKVLEECKICLQNLHSMQAVRENFKVQLNGGLKSWVNKKDREAIIVAVCQVNHVVFSVMQVINGGKVESIRLPCVDVEGETVDVLCDQRITTILLKHGVAQFSRGFWSFGRGDGQKLVWPTYVATDTEGQFVVADTGDLKVKVYSRGGMFQYSVCPLVDEHTITNLHAVAADRDDNVYVLVSLCSAVCVVAFDQHRKQPHKFLLNAGFMGFAMAVNDHNKVFVIGAQNKSYHVDVFEANGKFIHSFGKETLNYPRDIASVNDGLVLVLDVAHPACVTTFNAQGDVQQQFMLQDCSGYNGGSIAQNVDDQTVVVCLWDTSKVKKEKLLIYTTDGRLVLDVQQLDDETTLQGTRGVALTADGRIAVIKKIGHLRHKICVVQKKEFVFNS